MYVSGLTLHVSPVLNDLWISLEFSDTDDTNDAGETGDTYNIE
ncbi:15_t:CDS:2 [Scutellospora calospora]|uniref:15_t:CDS:1 n=1 Tax=Scutellospora calospora TaxID=85575 RepID=A0ACA9K1P5_9GLOM|nr:15_t:CDS:2 [Scutellospora calospora]